MESSVCGTDWDTVIMTTHHINNVVVRNKCMDSYEYYLCVPVLIFRGILGELFLISRKSLYMCTTY